MARLDFISKLHDRTRRDYVARIRDDADTRRVEEIWRVRTVLAIHPDIENICRY